MSIYEANETMKQIGRCPVDMQDSAAVKDILDAMGLPMTSDNIMLAVHAMEYGYTMGERGAKHTKKKNEDTEITPEQIKKYQDESAFLLRNIKGGKNNRMIYTILLRTYEKEQGY